MIASDIFYSIKEKTTKHGSMENCQQQKSLINLLDFWQSTNVIHLSFVIFNVISIHNIKHLKHIMYIDLFFKHI